MYQTIRDTLELTLGKFDQADPRFPPGDQLFYWWTQLRGAALVDKHLLHSRLIEVVQLLPRYLQAQTSSHANASVVGQYEQELYVIAADNRNSFSLAATCHLLLLLTEYISSCYRQRYRPEFRLDHTEYIIPACQLANAIWELRSCGGFIPTIDSKFQPIEPVELFSMAGLAYYALFNWYAVCRNMQDGRRKIHNNIFNIFPRLSDNHLKLLNTEKLNQADPWLAVSVALRIELGLSEHFPWDAAAASLLRQCEINWIDSATTLQLAQRCYGLLALAPYVEPARDNEQHLNKLLRLTMDGMIINKMSIDAETTCYVVQCMVAYLRRYSLVTTEA